MIAYIEGRLAEVCANACVVVTEGGVGYEVYLPQQMQDGDVREWRLDIESDLGSTARTTLLANLGLAT